MKKEDFKLKVEGGTLSISGERKEEKEEKDKKHHRVERSYGAFVRSFALPEVVLSEKVSAEFKDGILTVHVPKDEKAKPKAIVVVVFRHAALLSKESPAVDAWNCPVFGRAAFIVKTFNAIAQ